MFQKTYTHVLHLYVVLNMKFLNREKELTPQLIGFQLMLHLLYHSYW